ncbi:MAG: phenylacetate--CoA ligase family protein [Pseudomonadota bacterium]
MTDFFDARDTMSDEAREADLFSRLGACVSHAIANAQGWKSRLEGVAGGDVTSREALAALPVLRKPELMEKQAENPPFGGFATVGPEGFDRIFMSPGPVWEPQPAGEDPWNAARVLHAAGFRKGDIVHNALAYTMTPGGFIIDQGAVALGCAVYPAGTGNTEMQVAAMNALQPVGFLGTPDYLKAILDKAVELGNPISSVTKALVSGGALFPSLRAEYAERGVAVLQTYATADIGCIAYESSALEGLIVNEDIILEIVKPGTNEVLPDGEVGEIVVTTLKETYPLIRFGTGDMSAMMSGQSPCGRTGRRIKGWMGRADQRTKVKGMFVDPAQVDHISKAFPDLGRLRMEVTRAGEMDVLTLKAEADTDDSALVGKLEEAIVTHCKVKGTVELVPLGSLPKDGKLISDERDYTA